MPSANDMEAGLEACGGNPLTCACFIHVVQRKHVDEARRRARAIASGSFEDAARFTAGVLNPGLFPPVTVKAGRR